MHDTEVEVELVSDRYRIDESALKELAEDDEYWDNSHTFYLEVKDKDVSKLSERQESWLQKIENGLRER